MTPEQQVQRVKELDAWHDEDLEVDHLIAEYRSLAPALAGWVERLVEALSATLASDEDEHGPNAGCPDRCDWCGEPLPCPAQRARALLAEYRSEEEKP